MAKSSSTLYLWRILLILAGISAWVLNVYHLGTFPPPAKTRIASRPEVVERSFFADRQHAGINQLVVFGNSFEQGLAAGRLTAPLLEAEEKALVQDLNRFLPDPMKRWALMFGAMRWFWGIDAFLEPWATDEMYGVAQSAPASFNNLADPFTRQVAYHGVHEVGQMFVDFDKQDFGCTALGLPFRGSWIIGRNFDFDAVPILDTEKVVKWSFPDQGHAYVSVTWAGMVGTVTGINDRGVYVSINAAGTSDFRRLGTPTTLVALKALKEAENARAAVRIIEKSQTFITDLFVVADPAGELYRVEKTPKRFVTTRLTKASAVTNHLTADEFQADAINSFRIREQTTVQRLRRADELVQRWDENKFQFTEQAALQVAQFLRDKRDLKDRPLHLGHRSALDALIATHSVVYSAFDQKLWVSQGPALAGPYIGFDLKQSFERQTPVAIGELPADPEVNRSEFVAFKQAMSKLRELNLALKTPQCDLGPPLLKAIDNSPAANHYEYLMAKGNFFKACAQDDQESKRYWQSALAARPAYLRHASYLTEALR